VLIKGNSVAKNKKSKEDQSQLDLLMEYFKLEVYEKNDVNGHIVWKK